MLERAGELSQPEVKAAFQAVKRKDYCLGAQDDEDCYADRPFRSEQAHLSAPSIYARCAQRRPAVPDTAPASFRLRCELQAIGTAPFARSRTYDWSYAPLGCVQVRRGA
jgi:hypothetical protein